jgi:hypothetical protein
MLLLRGAGWVRYPAPVLTPQLALALALAGPAGSSGEAAGEDLRLPAPDPAEELGAARSRLRGRIFTLGGRDPVAGARVLVGESEVVFTDTEGRFEVMLAPGLYPLVLRADGHDELRTSVTLGARQDVEFEYRLAPDLEGSRYRTIVKQEREIAVSQTTLRDEEIHAVPGSRGDPFRVIMSLPGAAPVAGFLPYVVVRGAAPGNTGYYLDGVRVPILFHVAVGPAVVHPYFIDSVDFYPSGAPVRLGRYTSGIIEGRTRPASRDRVRGEFDVRLTDAGGILEIPINRPRLTGCVEERKRKCPKGQARGSLTLAGRYSYTAAALTLVQSSAKIAFWDYQARLDHRLGARGNYTLFVFGSYDEIGEKAAPQPFLRFEFHRVVNRVRQRIGEDGFVDYTVAFGLDRSGVADTRTLEWLISPRVDVRLPLRRSKRAVFGLGVDQEFQIFRVESDIEDPSAADATALILGDRTVSATGLYAELLWQQGRVELRPGLRADLYVQDGPSAVLPQARSVTHAWGFDPRVLVRERLSDRWTLRQNVGLYHQPPSLPVPIPGLESFGFERGLQRNLQGSVGYELRLGEQVILTQDAYLGRLSNLQDYDISAAVSGDVTEVEDLVTKVKGWAYGLETMLRLAPRMRLFGWAAYTLSRSTREFRVGGSAPSNWDQRHILNLVLGYRVGSKWSFGGRVHVHSGRPYTAQIGDQSFADALSSNRNNRRLMPFFQLDLRIERSWIFRTWMLQTTLDVINSTYAQEVLACLPSEQPATATQVYGARGCNAQALRYILPSLGLRGVF